MNTEHHKWAGGGRTRKEAEDALLRAWRTDPRTEKGLGLRRLRRMYGITLLAVRPGDSFKDGERG